MNRFFISTVAIISIIALSYHIYNLHQQNLILKAEVKEITKKLEPLKKENGQLATDLKYFKNPDNLEKELRSRLNYAEPGEQLVIIIPKKDE